MHCAPWGTPYLEILIEIVHRILLYHHTLYPFPLQFPRRFDCIHDFLVQKRQVRRARQRGIRSTNEEAVGEFVNAKRKVGYWVRLELLLKGYPALARDGERVLKRGVESYQSTFFWG